MIFAFIDVKADEIDFLFQTSWKQNFGLNI